MITWHLFWEPMWERYTRASICFLLRWHPQLCSLTRLSLVSFFLFSAALSRSSLISPPSSVTPFSLIRIDTLWATAIALAILETKYSKEQEKWTLLSTKAYLWMDKILENPAPPSSPPPSTPPSPSPSPPIFTSDDWVGFAKKWLESLWFFCIVF